MALLGNANTNATKDSALDEIQNRLKNEVERASQSALRLENLYRRLMGRSLGNPIEGSAGGMAKPTEVPQGLVGDLRAGVDSIAESNTRATMALDALDNVV